MSNELSHKVFLFIANFKTQSKNGQCGKQSNDLPKMSAPQSLKPLSVLCCMAKGSEVQV